jgi:NAD(P)-dependent dehydrogenase (short-subunit alcohol dehydrogenase family)
MKIKGHTAIVTGGASGLGAATVRKLADLGANVAVFDTNKQLAEEVAAEVDGMACVCDVSSAGEAEAAVAKVLSKLGTARILVNCAGIGSSGRIVGKEGPQPLEAFEKIIRVNLTGTFNMMRLVAAQMISSEPLEGGVRGVIISTASAAAYEGQVGQAAYAASKGGIVSLTLPAAREFAQFGIRVLSIAPGLIETPLLKGLSQEAKESINASIPFPKRMGYSEEFALLVSHIVENDYLNGETIRLDGALRLAPK